MDGFIPGKRAREVFEVSRLPIETLAQIWFAPLRYKPSSCCRDLVDTHQRGVLDMAEFIIAMHLIKSLISKSLSFLPISLPKHLIEAAKVGAATIQPSILVARGCFLLNNNSEKGAIKGGR